MIRKSVCCFVIFLLAIVSANASELRVFGDWQLDSGAATVGQFGGPLLSTHSEPPSSSDPTPAGVSISADIYCSDWGDWTIVIARTTPASLDERVSHVVLVDDGEQFPLALEENSASSGGSWLMLADKEKQLALLKLMRAGSLMTLRTSDQTGASSDISFSLSGVTAGTNEIMKTTSCKLRQAGFFEDPTSGDQPAIGEIQEPSEEDQDTKSVNVPKENQPRKNENIIDQNEPIQKPSHPILIIGEVNQPGQYPYVDGMTVIDAVNLAGGFTYRVNMDGLLVNNKPANLITKLEPGSTLSVPERLF